jgi:hypothetical protein
VTFERPAASTHVRGGEPAQVVDAVGEHHDGGATVAELAEPERRVDRVDERRAPPGGHAVESAPRGREVGGEGLEQLDLVVEREQGRMLAAAQAVEERPRCRLKRVELRPAHAPARVEDEHRVHGDLLLQYRLQVLEEPVVSQLEVGRSEAADRGAPARH